MHPVGGQVAVGLVCPPGRRFQAHCWRPWFAFVCGGFNMYLVVRVFDSVSTPLGNLQHLEISCFFGSACLTGFIS